MKIKDTVLFKMGKLEEFGEVEEIVDMFVKVRLDNGFSLIVDKADSKEVIVI